MFSLYRDFHFYHADVAVKGGKKNVEKAHILKWEFFSVGNL